MTTRRQGPSQSNDNSERTYPLEPTTRTRTACTCCDRETSIKETSIASLCMLVLLRFVPACQTFRPMFVPIRPMEARAAVWQGCVTPSEVFRPLHWPLWDNCFSISSEL